MVANGQAFFDLVVKDPSEFPKDMEFEALLSIAQQAYEQKHNDEWQYSSPISYETFENSVGWAS